ncbi:hypothetical protein [Nocardia sp. NPDC048505]|uniref:hypothetical protein n=1 Tax=unclassified Nocardia TaxID=2637762 RepID=UPI0033C2E50B
MDVNDKSEAERLAAIEAWQAFQGEIDAWVFHELDARIAALRRKLEESDPPADLGKVVADVEGLERLLSRRELRLRTFQRRGAL